MVKNCKLNTRRWAYSFFERERGERSRDTDSDLDSIAIAQKEKTDGDYPNRLRFVPQEP